MTTPQTVMTLSPTASPQDAFLGSTDPLRVADREKPDGQERKPARHQTMIWPAPQTKGRPGRPSRPMPDVLLPRRPANAASNYAARRISAAN